MSENEMTMREADRLVEQVDKQHEVISWCESVQELDSVADALRQEAHLRSFTPDGYVYILRSGPYVKIGRSKRAEQRIKQLKIQLPFTVEIVNVIPCEDYVQAEREMHELFSHDQVNGEWFAIETDRVLAHIRCVARELQSGLHVPHFGPRAAREVADE